MLVLNQFPIGDVELFARQLWGSNRDGLGSFETAARVVVESIYNEFRQENGESAFALVRVYRLCRTHELTPELQDLVGGARDDLWMALMGTIGDEAEWCSRHTSSGHRAISAGADQSPMLQAAFHQLGINPQSPANEADLRFEDASFLTKYFHIADAVGSPSIPAQEGFVVPYHIQSVVGIGSQFLSHSLYLALAFSKAFIDDEDAQKFAELSAFVSSLLATYDGSGVIWD
jgi:hypothetical protein